MATWFHPDAFADVDPKATLAEINARFLPVPLKGALWVDARKE
jgi:iron complex transport system substrate-binding protein